MFPASCQILTCFTNFLAEKDREMQRHFARANIPLLLSCPLIIFCLPSGNYHAAMTCSNRLPLSFFIWQGPLMLCWYIMWENRKQSQEDVHFQNGRIAPCPPASWNLLKLPRTSLHGFAGFSSIFWLHPHLKSNKCRMKNVEKFLIARKRFSCRLFTHHFRSKYEIWKAKEKS